MQKESNDLLIAAVEVARASRQRIRPKFGRHEQDQSVGSAGLHQNLSRYEHSQSPPTVIIVTARSVIAHGMCALEPATA